MGPYNHHQQLFPITTEVSNVRHTIFLTNLPEVKMHSPTRNCANHPPFREGSRERNQVRNVWTAWYARNRSAKSEVERSQLLKMLCRTKFKRAMLHNWRRKAMTALGWEKRTIALDVNNVYHRVRCKKCAGLEYFISF
jgi:hypothetical protein